MLKNAVIIAYYAEQDKAMSTYPIGTGMYFAKQVKTGGPWDYKLQYGVARYYWFNGKYVRGEDLGNMHYGYVGRGAGFSATILRSAAGAYQIYSGTSDWGWYNSYFDDPNDQASINYGIDLYNQRFNSRKTSFVPTDPTQLFYILSDSEKEQIKETAYQNSLTIKKELH